MSIALLALSICVDHASAGGLDDARAGELARESGDCDKAINLFTVALSEGLPRKNTQQLYVLRGVCFEANGLHDKAISDLDNALRMDPGDQEAFLDRGSAYAKKGEYEKALSDYNEALRLDPKYAIAYMDRGVVYKILAQYTKASADFDEAAVLDPDNSKILRNRAEFYIRMKRYDLGLTDYNEVVRLSPNGFDGLNGRGRLQFILRKFSAAKEDFQRAQQARPDSMYSLIWNFLAEARINVPKPPPFPGFDSKQSKNDWPSPIVEYLADRMSFEKLLRTADNDGKRCEVYAYAAEFEIAQAKRDLARRLLLKAKHICPASFVEGDLVAAELDFLDKK